MDLVSVVALSPKREGEFFIIAITTIYEIIMTKEEFFKISNRVKSQNTCLAHDFDPSNCQTTPISSHSIARNEQLSRLSESNKVYIWEKENCDEKIFHELDKSNGKLNFSFRDFTIKKASTFPGFCNYHDTKLFSLIDKPISTFTKETILQLHYRAICYEFFRKKNLLNYLMNYLTTQYLKTT